MIEKIIKCDLCDHTVGHPIGVPPIKSTELEEEHYLERCIKRPETCDKHLCRNCARKVSMLWEYWECSQKSIAYEAVATATATAP